MKGYQIWEKCSELVDEFDSNETRVIKHYPYTSIFLNKEQAQTKLEELYSKPLPWRGNPISCYSETLEFYIKEVNIIE